MSISTVYDDVVTGVYEEEPDESALPSVDLDLAGAGEEEEEEEEDREEDREEDQAEDSEVLTVAVTDPYGGCMEAEPDAETKVAAQDSDIPAHNPNKRKRGMKRKRQPEQQISDPEQKSTALRRQVEYYFSDKNLSQDSFFHEKISEDAEGWLNVSWILGCARIKQLGITQGREIEAALKGSHLETRWLGEQVQSESGADASTLQIRRSQGSELPKLQLRPAGWLATKVEQRKKAADVQEPVATGAPKCLPAVGESARLLIGEHKGKIAKVLAVDDEEFTLLLDDAEVVIAAAAELEKDV